VENLHFDEFCIVVNVVTHYGLRCMAF